MSGICGVRSGAPSELKRKLVEGLLGATGASDGATRSHCEAPGIAIGAGSRGRVLSSRRFLLAADARLDGRAELARILKLDSDREDDVALILAAWERWGDHAPFHLVGDYALAVWDLAERRLHLVRDAIGMRPLFFTPTAFSSRADSLHVGNATHHPCASALRRHLAWRDIGTESYFEGVERVQPGEQVTLCGERTVHERWWRPSLTPVKWRSADLIAECRTLLDAAVADRIGDSGAVLAAHFSAGLDSATAAALAARLKPKDSRLIALTAVPAIDMPNADARLVDEGPLAEFAAATLPDTEHHRVPAAGDPISPLLSAPQIFQQPLPNPHNHLWVRAINEEAARAGARVLLMGQLGNYSFSMSGDPHHRLKTLAKRVLRRAGTWQAGPKLVRDAEQVAATDEALPAGGAERRLHFLRRLDPGCFMMGIEDRWALSPRDPFADRRLIEFSLCIPEAALARLGDRGLARPIAAELLPPGFVANPRRGYQAADWIEQLRRHRGAMHDLVSRGRDHALVGELVDLAACDVAIARLNEASRPDAAEEQLFRVDLPRVLAVIGFITSLEFLPLAKP